MLFLAWFDSVFLSIYIDTLFISPGCSMKKLFFIGSFAEIGDLKSAAIGDLNLKNLDLSSSSVSFLSKITGLLKLKGLSYFYCATVFDFNLPPNAKFEMFL